MCSSSKPKPKPVESSEVFREECYRCFRAAAVCICDQVPSIKNQTGVIVLQHHREVTHPIGTARIANLGLKNVDTRIARRHMDLQVPSEHPEGTALLYPHSQAVTLEEMPASQLPRHLIVLDGTWAQASAMYRANDWLHELPHVVIRPSSESNYRIRKQPRKGCLSTIEALVQALQSIEPQTEGLEKLLEVFNSMVDEQIKRMTGS